MITLFTTRVRLSNRIATADDLIAVPGITLWVVEYDRVQHGKERSYVTPCVSEAGARRMISNLLADRAPGLAVEEVYSEELG
ncbi:MAG: hypothetical protein H6523_12970 [Mycolicibacterium sp.]|nr:hypothetical protein [Mycolicibacterium sp.]